MRKLIALAVVCTTALVFAAVAYAVNSYKVTPASTKGGGGPKAPPRSRWRSQSCSASRPRTAGGERATPIKTYKIGFQGLKYFGNKSVFPKCTYAKINQKLESDVEEDCGKAYMGKGMVNNLVGRTAAPDHLGHLPPAPEALQPRQRASR